VTTPAFGSQTAEGLACAALDAFSARLGPDAMKATTLRCLKGHVSNGFTSYRFWPLPSYMCLLSYCRAHAVRTWAHDRPGAPYVTTCIDHEECLADPAMAVACIAARPYAARWIWNGFGWVYVG